MIDRWAKNAAMASTTTMSAMAPNAQSTLNLVLLSVPSPMLPAGVDHVDLCCIPGTHPICTRFDRSQVDVIQNGTICTVSPFDHFAVQNPSRRLPRCIRLVKPLAHVRCQRVVGQPGRPAAGNDSRPDLPADTGGTAAPTPVARPADGCKSAPDPPACTLLGRAQRRRVVGQQVQCQAES